MSLDYPPRPNFELEAIKLSCLLAEERRKRQEVEAQLDMAVEVINNSINWDFDGQTFWSDIESLRKYLKEFLDSLKGDKRV